MSFIDSKDIARINTHTNVQFTFLQTFTRPLYCPWKVHAHIHAHIHHLSVQCKCDMMMDGWMFRQCRGCRYTLNPCSWRALLFFASGDTAILRVNCQSQSALKSLIKVTRVNVQLWLSCKMTSQTTWKCNRAPPYLFCCE